MYLKAVLWLLRAANDNGLELLSDRIIEWLDFENTVRLISDSTYGYVMDGAAFKDENVDVHAAILSLLFEINSIIPKKDGKNALIKPLLRLIESRHAYLGKL